MQYILFVVIAVVAGILIPVQSGLNARLGEAANSPALGALLSFVVGTTGMFLYCLFGRSELSAARSAFELPWYYWLGGLMGAFFVYTLIVVPPRLGIALTLGITVAAQMIFGMVMDHYGWLGFPQDSISLAKIIGAILIIGGVFLLRS